MPYSKQNIKYNQSKIVTVGAIASWRQPIPQFLSIHLHQKFPKFLNSDFGILISHDHLYE